MADNTNTSMNYEITEETETTPARVIAQVKEYAIGVLFIESLTQDYNRDWEAEENLEPDARCITTEKGSVIYRINTL